MGSVVSHETAAGRRGHAHSELVYKLTEHDVIDKAATDILQVQLRTLPLSAYTSTHDAP